MGGKCGARTHAHYLHPETAGRYLVFGFVVPCVVLFKEEDKKELSEGSGACIVPLQLHVDLGMDSLKEKQCRSTHSLSQHGVIIPSFSENGLMTLEEVV